MPWFSWHIYSLPGLPSTVDYFLVRKGVYVIGEIFKKDGIYGRWGWRGNTAYALGLAAMIPFFVTTPYVGPIAKV